MNIILKNIQDTLEGVVITGLQFLLIAALVTVLAFSSITGIPLVQAEPSTSGVSGMVYDTNENPVVDAEVQFGCGENPEYWPTVAYTDEFGDYERIGIYDGNLGCEGSADGGFKDASSERWL